MKLKPIITEKSIKDAQNKRYTFEISTSYSKDEIRKNIEKTFKVNVMKVQTAIVPGKNYRSGKRWIYRSHSDWKKAIVTIKPDQKIELFDIPNTK